MSAVLLALIGASAVPAAAGSHLSSVPGQFIGQGRMNDVAAVATNDVWAVGCCAQLHRDLALIEHWDGKAWAASAAPSGTRGLESVLAISATDVWAAGDRAIIHWDGSQWTTSEAPDARIHAMAAVASNDIWAVGNGYDDDRAMILHWDGTSWVQMTQQDNGTLIGVGAAGPDDVWAVGARFNADPLVYHWDGTRWHSVESPMTAPDAVLALSPDNIWMVGGNDRATIANWDGQRWNLVTTTVKQFSGLSDISATSPTDIWAAGWIIPENRERGLVMHWDGSSWKRTTAPKPSHNRTYLFGVAAVGPSDIWAVGMSLFQHRYDIQIRGHWNGTSWRLR